MEKIKTLNKIIVFLLELAMFVSFGHLGFQSKASMFFKVVLAAGLPVLAGIVWAVFIAPKSAYRLPLVYRTLLTTVLFLLSALSYYRLGYPALALTIGITTLLCEALSLLLEV